MRKKIHEFIYLILISSLVIIPMIYGTFPIGVSIALIPLSGLSGFIYWINSKQEKDVNEEVKKDLIEIKDKINKAYLSGVLRK